MAANVLGRGADTSAVSTSPPAPRPKVNRLVKEPVFVMCSVRSGSTMLRLILDSHSQICSPHELHLRTLKVTIKNQYGKLAMSELGLSERRLEYLLWDRVLHRELSASGKAIIVDKTPSNVFIWERLAEAWPKARYLFLYRHPAAIANSLFNFTDEETVESAVKRTGEYLEAFAAARDGLAGLSVRYEDLVSDPDRITAEICEFIGVPWEPAMVNYGEFDHGKIVKFVGDASEKLHSGVVQREVALPAQDEIPESLREITRRLGYASAGGPEAIEINS
ncbi:MAG TPA: sulfotransferase [Mycobacteriales bacterium]|nr:sulfotransferase [Mycobacteriales bacterium]